MSIVKRLQALEKSRGSSYVFVDKSPYETEEEALARYLAEHSEKPQAVIFVGPLDWKI